MRTPASALFTAAICSALLLTGCAGPVEGKIEPKASAEPSAADTAAATDEAEAPTAKLGTRTNPFPTGTAGKHASDSVWTFSAGETDTDAWPEILAVNEYNEAPAEGNGYITVPVTVQVDDVAAVVDGADPSYSFDVSYVTASGNTYDGTTCLGVLPDPGELYNVGVMYGGAQAGFIGCAQVPTADIPGGAWVVSSLVAGSTAFFAGPAS
ncbi:hypothetical protein [Cryobacterium psychrophilum]|uniref:Uncharacterized protein n=1 Tax=Cryobacterium psychrophilum TaxID=41988 RepID=A0A4Y8KMD7_9MICO|nr:hypothetical protein [Cryobacterium psychrophilum]TDW31411.1 hypothetical protein EDD25_3225 [Cryobacterium psychrophilum]TFD78853.1 hypothetical protein E3T53_08680 [Cryobacterium psychrophilum]